MIFQLSRVWSVQLSVRLIYIVTKDKCHKNKQQKKIKSSLLTSFSKIDLPFA